MSDELQLIVVCSLCYLLPLIVSAISFCFDWVEDAHGKYIVACIISLIFFLGYIIISDKQSSPLICDIVNCILNTLYELGKFKIVVWFIYFMVIPSLIVFILLFISYLIDIFSVQFDKIVLSLKEHNKDN